jgi:thiol-disulfide isomerase/thioredoxin
MIKKTIAFVLACLIGGTAYARPPVFMNNYESAVKVSNDLGIDILLVFSADWCKYCKMLKKDLSASVSKDELKDLIICTINVDENTKIKKEYSVSSIPDSVYLSKNKIKSRRKGYNDLSNYLKWLKSNR